jgi:prolyl-tRNA synthetase
MFLRNLISGANKDDYHVRNLIPGRDFKGEFKDLREVVNGDPCIRCGRPLKVELAIEVGHIFKLGRKYSTALGVRVLDEDGKEIIPIMGSYGIGMERILSAAAEQHHDDNGLKLPRAIAPFDVVLTSTDPRKEDIREAAERLYEVLKQAGVDVLYDDRDERPGVKFKDADLIGVPLRITVGKKVPDGLVELSERSTGVRADAKISEVVNLVQSRYCG